MTSSVASSSDIPSTAAHSAHKASRALRSIAHKLSADGATSGRYTLDPDLNRNVEKANGTYKLKAGNYHFYTEIFESDNKTWISIACEEHGQNYSDDPEFYYQEFYKD